MKIYIVSRITPLRSFTGMKTGKCIVACSDKRNLPFLPTKNRRVRLIFYFRSTGLRSVKLYNEQFDIMTTNIRLNPKQ